MYSPDQYRPIHFNKDYLISKKVQEIKRIASEGRNFRESNHENYLNRIKQLQAESYQIYNDSKLKSGSKIDQQIQQELAFIHQQVETVKNELRSCDSLTSGRQRSNNPSILSSNTVEYMQSKLSRMYTNHTNNTVANTKRRETPISPKDKKSNSFLSWKTNYNTKICKPIISNNQFLFCLFTKLNNSNTIQLIERNKIQIIQNERSSKGNLSLTFKNPILTSLKDIQMCYNQNKMSKSFMIIGGKSTTKKKIVEQLIKQIIEQFNVDILSIKLQLAIHGSVSNTESMTLIPFSFSKQEMPLYNIECHMQSLENIYKQLNNFMQESLMDIYYQVKDYLHNKSVLIQNSEQKKSIINLLHKELHCIKAFKIEVSTYNEKWTYNIVTTNYIESLENKQSMPLLSNGKGHSFILESLSAIENQEDTIRIFTINPLRYRFEDTLKLLKFL